MCVHICVCAYIYVYTHIQSYISREFQKLHVHLRRITSTSDPLLHQERRGSKLVSMLNSQSMNTRGGERSMHPKVPPPKGCCPAMLGTTATKQHKHPQQQQRIYIDLLRCMSIPRKAENPVLYAIHTGKFRQTLPCEDWWVLFVCFGEWVGSDIIL